MASVVLKIDDGLPLTADELAFADRGGHRTVTTRTVVVDRIAPQITFFSPVAGEYTAATALDVTGGVVDATPVVVRVEGVTASDVVTGPYDVIAKIRGATLDDAAKLVVSQIQAIDGITRTYTCPVFTL